MISLNSCNHIKTFNTSNKDIAISDNNFVDKIGFEARTNFIKNIFTKVKHAISVSGWNRISLHFYVNVEENSQNLTKNIINIINQRFLISYNNRVLKNESRLLNDIENRYISIFHERFAFSELYKLDFNSFFSNELDNTYNNYLKSILSNKKGINFIPETDFTNYSNDRDRYFNSKSKIVDNNQNYYKDVFSNTDFKLSLRTDHDFSNYKSNVQLDRNFVRIFNSDPLDLFKLVIQDNENFMNGKMYYEEIYTNTSLYKSIHHNNDNGSKFNNLLGKYYLNLAKENNLEIEGFFKVRNLENPVKTKDNNRLNISFNKNAFPISKKLIASTYNKLLEKNNLYFIIKANKGQEDIFKHTSLENLVETRTKERDFPLIIYPFIMNEKLKESNYNNFLYKYNLNNGTNENSSKRNDFLIDRNLRSLLKTKYEEKNNLLLNTKSILIGKRLNANTYNNFLNKYNQYHDRKDNYANQEDFLNSISNLVAIKNNDLNIKFSINKQLNAILKDFYNDRNLEKLFITKCKESIVDFTLPKKLKLSNFYIEKHKKYYIKKEKSFNKKAYYKDINFFNKIHENDLNYGRKEENNSKQKKLNINIEYILKTKVKETRYRIQNKYNSPSKYYNEINLSLNRYILGKNKKLINLNYPLHLNPENVMLNSNYYKANKYLSNADNYNSKYKEILEIYAFNSMFSIENLNRLLSSRLNTKYINKHYFLKSLNNSNETINIYSENKNKRIHNNFDFGKSNNFVKNSNFEKKDNYFYQKKLEDFLSSSFSNIIRKPFKNSKLLIINKYDDIEISLKTNDNTLFDMKSFKKHIGNRNIKNRSNNQLLHNFQTSLYQRDSQNIKLNFITNTKALKQLRYNIENNIYDQIDNFTVDNYNTENSDFVLNKFINDFYVSKLMLRNTFKSFYIDNQKEQNSRTSSAQVKNSYLKKIHLPNLSIKYGEILAFYDLFSVDETSKVIAKRKLWIQNNNSSLLNSAYSEQQKDIYIEQFNKFRKYLNKYQLTNLRKNFIKTISAQYKDLNQKNSLIKQKNNKTELKQEILRQILNSHNAANKSLYTYNNMTSLQSSSFEKFQNIGNSLTMDKSKMQERTMMNKVNLVFADTNNNSADSKLETQNNEKNIIKPITRKEFTTAIEAFSESKKTKSVNDTINTIQKDNINRTKNKNNTIVDSLSNDEINKLVDKFYDRLERKIINEKRRFGL